MHTEYVQSWPNAFGLTRAEIRYLAQIRPEHRLAALLRYRQYQVCKKRRYEKKRRQRALAWAKMHRGKACR